VACRHHAQAPPGRRVGIADTSKGSASVARAIGTLRADDTLIVTRLDRLARSTRDLLNTLDAAAKKGATFKSLADTWADTKNRMKRPTARLLELLEFGGNG
jgi:DNA invertase Pin-like site-specific DNA recombinase